MATGGAPNPQNNQIGGMFGLGTNIIRIDKAQYAAGLALRDIERIVTEVTNTNLRINQINRNQLRPQQRAVVQSQINQAYTVMSNIIQLKNTAKREYQLATHTYDRALVTPQANTKAVMSYTDDTASLSQAIKTRMESHLTVAMSYLASVQQMEVVAQRAARPLPLKLEEMAQDYVKASPQHEACFRAMVPYFYKNLSRFARE